jgi:hypothetical protein
MPSSDTTTPESAVRSYLQFLEDPSKLVDAAAVKSLEGALAKAKDPVDRLKAIAALEKANATDEAVYRAEFVKLAKQWAIEEGVPAAAFREMGVPADVLSEAGLNAQPQGRRRAKAGTAPRLRRPPVKSDALEAGILAMREPFTIKDVVDKVGGSPMTVKVVVDRLEAQEKISTAGERANARGRASKLWTVA